VRHNTDRPFKVSPIILTASYHC